MGTSTPHAVFIPQPAQGHLTPFLQLAKIFHYRGFHVTFVNSDYNHRRLLRSRGPDSLDGFNDFRFVSIPDGLPLSDQDVTQDIAELCVSMTKNCVVPFRDLLMKLNSTEGVPKVSCVIADGVMSFAQRVAKELGILALLFWTTSACGFMGYLHFSELIRRGYIPLKDESDLINGYLETPIDWIPGMTGIRLKDIPSFIRTTDPNDVMLNFDGGEAQNALKAQGGLILNTFNELEDDVILAMKTMFPRLYTIGPLSKFVDEISQSPLNSIGSSLWKEDSACLKWLDNQKCNSVIYVNFGSITTITADQMREFAWGLADSKHPFLWVIRPDLVTGKNAVIPEEFFEETGGLGFVASWCSQEQVLRHPSVRGFLTHCGWNSMLESICGGVPMICWPFFAEQPTNCRFACAKWGIGMEIDTNVRRGEVEAVVRELMEGDKGKEMRLKAMNWKKKADLAVEQGGSSFKNMEILVENLLRGVMRH